MIEIAAGFVTLFTIIISFLIFLSLRKIGKELEQSNKIFGSISISVSEVMKTIEEIKYIELCKTGMNSISLKAAIEKDVELENDY